MDDPDRSIAAEERVIYLLIIFAALPRLIGGLVRGDRDYGVALCVVMLCLGLVGLGRRCAHRVPRAIARSRGRRDP